MSGRTLAVLAISVGLSGCVSANRTAQPGNRNIIGQADIQATRASNAFEAVQQLRPHFLRGRAVGSGNAVRQQTPIVYLDGTRLGDLQQLQTIPASMILTIELISATDATTRWGTGYPAGVIEVRSRS